MELRDISMEDLPLYERVLTDPDMMSELGGPLPKQGLSEKLRGIVESIDAGTVWFSVIVPDGVVGDGAGTVCIWDHDWNGERISEIGWMVLPAFQGRGLATAAVRSILRKARSESRWDMIHAFPAVTNAPSNAICRKTGFSKIEECDFPLPGPDPSLQSLATRPSLGRSRLKAGVQRFVE
ncbi:MAG: GNAT family N-acetyltransferase [Actinomycetota bacterium]